MTIRPGISTRGNKTIRADWVTPYRQFSTWHQPEATHTKGMRDWQAFEGATDNGNQKPETISYCKDIDSTFYRILAYNRPADVEPQKDKAA